MADETIVTERVSMQWPKELKEQVREKVGARGLTEFVLEAVSAHLENGSPEVTQELQQEINELKWLAQQLADRAAMGGSNEERRASLMELDLPTWISTAGWPVDIAELVTPTPMVECPNHPRHLYQAGGECRQCKLEEKAQAAETEVGPAPVAPEPRERVSGDDHLMKVMEMARKKGVDMPSIDIKPASRIDPPPPTDKPTEEAIEVMEKVVAIATEEDPSQVEAEQLRAEAASAAGLCSKCGDELIDGECWTCDV